MGNEIQQIIERYERRKKHPFVKGNLEDLYFSHYIQSERELKYTEIIKSRFRDTGSIKLLEIGAGSGSNLCFFTRIGFLWRNLYANELLPDRLATIKNSFPHINIISGDASSIPEIYNGNFHIILQSTVFTSILDYDFKKKLADRMWKLLKPGGIIIWYDFIYNNPKNKDVKGIKKAEIRRLFANSKCINFYRVTLAPPIGRRVKKLYPFINIFSLLRTHVIAEIEK